MRRKRRRPRLSISRNYWGKSCRHINNTDKDHDLCNGCSSARSAKRTHPPQYRSNQPTYPPRMLSDSYLCHHFCPLSCWMRPHAFPHRSAPLSIRVSGGSKQGKEGSGTQRGKKSTGKKKWGSTHLVAQEWVIRAATGCNEKICLSSCWPREQSVSVLSWNSADFSSFDSSAACIWQAGLHALIKGEVGR